MSVIHGNEKDFENLINNDLIVVDFFATWCGPCQMLAPVLEELANADDSFDVVKIDIDSDRDLAIQYDIEAVPTLILFKNGTEIDRTLGFLDENELKNFINKYKE